MGNNTYSARILSFRESIIKSLPRVPNDRDSLAAIQLLSTNQLISAFITWRMRLIPKKPRAIRFWSGGITPTQLIAAKQKIRPLLEKVSAGDDLTPHLSDLVNKKGFVLPSARNEERGKDIDSVLIRHGLHHFHVGTPSKDNKKGRSGSLVFAEVLESEFRVVAIADHRVFEPNSAEHLEFFKICYSYIAKDLQPGEGFMPNPVMTSGHSVIVTFFGNKCEDEMRRLDALLDKPEFINDLYEQNEVIKDGRRIKNPTNPSLTWHFEDLEFGILDKKNKVFFCIFPFFAR